ncbi:MAG: 4-hydroxythreonine-4-phosphate dehydrogenase PdxA [Synechococcaceae cyanobacterium]|nr:4-hydroxythreonine-4-phosphate dehydrogenase PdxA [Synechococcaceae cyanobacterium]
MARQNAKGSLNLTGTRLIISLGDPAGIGAEVTLKALARPQPPGQEVLLVGCRRWLEESYMQLRRHSPVPLADPADVPIDDLPLERPVQAGISDAAAGDASFAWLTRAVERVMEPGCRGLVTAPIAKASWHAAGHDYPGQTERLAELAGMENASMLFTARNAEGSWRLNTLLATTHIPLAAVPQHLDARLVQGKLDVLLAFCRRFRPDPRLVVAGLNPHAGEGGALGREEREWLEACLEQWRAQHPQVRLMGPLPPDTCWLEAASAWRGEGEGPDGYLALYHDQGLIPVKLLAFDAAVNTSLGLPFLRTSPDHGTAFNLAGRGLARERSMVAAIEAAWELGAREPAAALSSA